MKTYKNFFTCIVISTLCNTASTYAYKASYFEFIFKNKTDNHLITVTRITKPFGSTLQSDIGSTNMEPNEQHHFLLLQDNQPSADKIPYTLTIKMSWLLTVKNKKGEIVCQNKVLGWVKGKTFPLDGKHTSTLKWRYNILSIQNSFNIKMCPFDGINPQPLPPSDDKNGRKCYPFNISIEKDNSIHVG